jgi:amino acid adenylation domain-containing protein
VQPAASESEPGFYADAIAAWNEVFGRVDISPDDDFFDLGGDSLMATMIASRVKHRLGIDVTPGMLFDAPTPARFVTAIEASAARRRASPLSFDRADRTVPVRVSSQQERMWFLQQMQPTGTAYNLPQALRLRGSLRVESLRWSLDRLLERHESLRTSFAVRQGLPVQHIASRLAADLPVLDFSAIDAPDRLDAVVANMQAVTTTPFDLTALPLIRTRLYRLGDDDHVLLVVTHHIISDHWAYGLLNRELSGLYNSHARGGGLQPVAVGKVQHADFVDSDARWMNDDALEGQLGYWKQQLAGMTPCEVPADRPRPPAWTSDGAAIIIPFADDLACRVNAYARSQRASSFMVLLAVYQLLLHRYTGVDDITVGCPVANRHRLASEDLISVFVNTLVFRTDLSGQPTFDDLVGRVKAVSLDAFAHQDVPFDRLVSELRPPRDPSRSPLFQAFFNVQNAPMPLPSFDGLAVEWVSFDHRAAQFDFSLMIDTVWAKTVTLEYNTDLFEAERMQRMLGHYLTLLEAALAAPGQHVGALAMLTDDELSAIAAAEKGPTVAFDESAGVHDLVAAQARRTPDAPAVSFGDRTLTYAEVERRANRLARRLIDAGVARGDAVGVHLERSAEMVVALLGVLKAGAHYLPLDPSFPADRLEFMQADARIEVVVTTSHLVGSASGLTNAICLDREQDTDAPDEHEPPAVVAGGEDLAYVIYTSGSTGRPKGVQIEHRNVVNLLASMADEPGICSDDVLLSVTTLSFDISVLEIFLPLTTGAHVVIADRQTTLDPLRLAAAIKRWRPTVMQATPTTWLMLIDAGWIGDTSLTVLCGGEPMIPELARSLLVRCKALWNVYGPTETTVWSAIKRIEPGFARITIGAPIANTTLEILDAHRRRLPCGLAGELLIGGAGVARGYLDRPELTDERFIVDPDDPASRLYRTGDLAQRLPDGDIELLGRIDNQIKLRGHRIELGEIEAALAGHPAVTRAVVTTHQFGPGDTRLVAYYTHDGDPDPTELSEHLQATLPRYMIPAAYVALDEFPLTPNKKVDRNALPSPGAVSGEAGGDPPRPGIESEIASIWRTVLGVERIDRDDDFFDLGGHSLLAIRVFVQLEKLTGQAFPLSSLFKASTVCGFAELLQQDGWHAEWTSMVAVHPDGHLRPYFVVAPFRITALSFASLARHLGADRPLYVFQPQGMESDAPAHATVAEMAAHYISELKQVQPRGPYAIGGHCAGNWVAFEMASQLQAAGDELALLVLVDSEPPGVPAPPRPRMRHILHRTRHYLRHGRFRDALRWQIGLARERFRAWRGAGSDRERVARVRAIHAQAHRDYQGGLVRGDALFIRSEESITLTDKDWHLKWADVITGELRVESVPGTHATLVEDANAKVIADLVTKALSPTDPS